MPTKEELRAQWNSAGKDVVVLHALPRARTRPNISPFGIKVETYLRMANIKYVIDHEQPLSAKGKSPWITFNGEDVADSQLCVEYLAQKLDKDVDKDLSNEEKALARALRIMLEDHLYWCSVTWHLIHNKGRFFKPVMPKMPVPGFLQGVVFSLTSSKLSGQAKAQGSGRHSKPEVEKMCLDDLRAVSTRLGGKRFMFGKEPCLLDAVVFAFVTGAITSPDEDDGPIKKAIVGEGAELANLKQHFDRMKEKFYPDWDDLLWKPKPKPEKTTEAKERAAEETKAKEEDKPAEAEAAKAK